jgi:DNA-binding CsgD family transcriptional regulator
MDIEWVHGGPGLLTAKQREVLIGAAVGETAEQTGRRLFLARATIKGHRTSLLAKLDARSMAQAVATAIATGEIVAAVPTG